jgi:hypothetical protein
LKLVENRRVRCAPLLLRRSPLVELNCLGCRRPRTGGNRC